MKIYYKDDIIKMIRDTWGLPEMAESIENMPEFKAIPDSYNDYPQKSTAPIKWADFNPEPIREVTEKPTNIECPKCGERLIKRLDLILTSNPPKYVYVCRYCNWGGYNY